MRDQKGRLLKGHGGLKQKGTGNLTYSSELLALFLKDKIHEIDFLYNSLNDFEKLSFIAMSLSYLKLNKNSPSIQQLRSITEIKKNFGLTIESSTEKYIVKEIKASINKIEKKQKEKQE